MPTDDLINSVFAQRRSTYDPSLSDDDAFEIFCADLILNTFDPSIEDIEARIVDGSQDGGIDSAFIYVNRVLVADDTDLSAFKHPVDVEFIIIQSKNEVTFKEGPVDKIAASLPNLLRDLNRHPSSQGSLNTSVVEAFELWNKASKTLAPEFPNFKIQIWYACKGNAVPPSAVAKANTLEGTIRSFLPKAQVSFNFAGANKLYELAGQQKLLKAELSINGSPLFGSNSSYIVLATLSNYGKFIADEYNVLRSSFFDANVRDYEGSVDVNKDIAVTLRDPIQNIDFWWMNNGVTILAAKAAFSNGKMNLQNPLVVNGLQTSYELHRWIRSGGSDDKRLVMVRIIETVDEDVINKIIKATNYQTKVKAYSLRATEEIHRRIELFLLNYEIFYDRRRNFYKNNGKPAARTIGIDRMAQAVTSVLLEKPHIARARPTSLMKEAIYDEIFPSGDNEHPLPVYLLSAEALFSAGNAMANSQYDRLYKNNLRFHALMALGWHLAGSQSPNAQQLAAVDIKKIAKSPINEIIHWVVSEFDKTAKTDAVAKDSDFTDALKDRWVNSGLA